MLWLYMHTWVSPHHELMGNSAASSTARECQGWNMVWSTLRHCWHSLGNEEPFHVSAQDEPRVNTMGGNHSMPSASSLANLIAWQGNVLPWFISLCFSKGCSPDRAIAMCAPALWLPISHLLMVLMSEAKFTSQRPYSAVLRLSPRSYPGNR